jgi:hypothetical protein
MLIRKTAGLACSPGVSKAWNAVHTYALDLQNSKKKESETRFIKSVNRLKEQAIVNLMLMQPAIIKSHKLAVFDKVYSVINENRSHKMY